MKLFTQWRRDGTNMRIMLRSSEIVQFYLSGSFISLDKMKQRTSLFALLEDLTSGNKAIVQSIVSPLIQHLLLKTFSTAHWGGPYGGKEAPGSWLSGGHRENQTKGWASRPSASQSLNGALADSLLGLAACTFSNQSDLWKLATPP